MLATSFRHALLVKLLSGIGMVAIASLCAADQTVKFSVDAGKHDRTNTPIKVPVSIDASLKDAKWASVNDDAGNSFVAQITPPSLLATAEKSKPTDRELIFVLPKLAAGQTNNYTATISKMPAEDIKLGPQFHWQGTAGEYDDLLFGDRPVIRYMYHKLDESTADARMETFKPYHHMFDPSTGTLLLTKGAEGTHADYPHHHGIFYGFRKLTYDDGKKCDIWHCPAAYQEHAAFLAQRGRPGVRPSTRGDQLGRGTEAGRPYQPLSGNARWRRMSILPKRSAK